MAKKIYTERKSPLFGSFPMDVLEVIGAIGKPPVDENGTPLDYHETEIIPLENAVPFPYVHFPMPVTDDTRDALHKAEKDHRRIVLAVRLAGTSEKTAENFICRDAVIVRVMKVIALPDSREMAFIQADERVFIEDFHLDKDRRVMGNLKPNREYIRKGKEREFEITVTLVEETFERFISMMKPQEEEVSVSVTAEPIEGADSREKDFELILNRIALNAPIDHIDRLQLLKISDLALRARQLLNYLNKVEKLLSLRHKIYDKANEEISQMQKEQFLQHQIKLMNEELHGDSEFSDVEKFRARALEMDWPEDVAKRFEKEVAKLARYNTNSPDYSIQYGYLENMLALPWNRVRQSDIDLDRLEEDLDRDHFGLEKVKERIVEHIAVLKLRGDMRSPILCLYGPPGVGKTSLCRSVADSIHREYVRMSLGGLHDEAEIRGHRKTYVGAMPGRIIDALTRCESNNPVFVLDEIDKIGKDYKGDPAQALLEVLDPEQNSRFHDNYLEVDYDLSKIFFIATANTTSTISPPLLDRMELIDISGYILEEKMEIARRHLIPKQLLEHGFKKSEIKFSDDALRLMIESYTRESGVRKLEKVIAKVLRKLAVKKARGLKFKKTVSEKLAKELLGKPEITPDVYEGNENIGVVTGLAWTAVGGEILYIESSLSAGKGDLSLTGNLGDVMKESATIALQWLRANAEKVGIDPKSFAEKNVHIHVPEGAVPKDGPSAGITMLTSLASSFTKRKVKKGVAMTGEITLRGKVLPVGGIKEKILAAKRAGITEIVLSEQNRKDIEEIGSQYIDGLDFYYVASAMDVLDHVIEPSKIIKKC